MILEIPLAKVTAFLLMPTEIAPRGRKIQLSAHLESQERVKMKSSLSNFRELKKSLKRVFHSKK